MTTRSADLTLTAEAGAPARAREFTAAQLGDAPASVVEDARLVVTELVTNALLHGAAPVSVRTLVRQDTYRLEVEDAGRSMLVIPSQSADAMTGRGLSLVAALSSRWGVEPGPTGGKVVFAELAPRESPVADEGPQLDVDALLSAWQEDEAAEPVHTVELGSVPTGLLLDAKRHIDNVVREMTLERAGASGNAPLPPELEALIDVVTTSFAQARAEIKQQAAEAAARGDAETRLVLTLPASAAAAGEAYLAALDEADRYARADRLLTLETPPLHRVFRRWYVQALVDQLRARSRGDVPARPPTFVQVLSDEVSALSRLRETAHRLGLLQQVNAELTSASTAEEMAQVVTRTAVQALGAASARVYLESHGQLLSIVQEGGTAERVARSEAVSLEEELPGPIAFRTGQPVVLRGLAEIIERFPSLAGVYDTERSLHVVPLTVRTHRLGILSIAFPITGTLDEEAQTAFVRALADALAQALERHLAEQALRTERDVVASLHQVGQAVTSRLEHGEVVQTVTDAATTMTGAQFGAFFYNVVGDSGESYALYTVSGVPREAFSRFPMPRNTEIFGPTFAGEGIVRLHDVTADPRYGRMPPHLGMPQGHLPVRSYLAVPVVLSDGEVIGGLFFGHADAGVFDEDAERLAAGIAAYAAIALENGRLYDAARRESRLKERVAWALERPLQPPPLPAVPGMDLAGLIEPFHGEGGLGGDFFDAFEIAGGRWLVALGDVSGKGPEAAAVTGLVRDTVWAAAQQSADIADVVRILNAALLRQDDGRFATLVIGVLVPVEGGGARLDAAWCGHPPAVLLRRDGTARLVGADGLPMGMFPDVSIAPLRIELTPGDTLVIHTDGLTERAGAVLSDDALVRLATSAGGGTLPDLLRALVDQVDRAHPRRDDIALLGLRVRES